MKIHYTIHLVSLAAVVYLAAQVNSPTANNNSEIQKQNTLNIDDSSFNKKLDEYKRVLTNKDKEIKLLEKSTEVANDKIKSLKKEVSGLLAENTKLKNNPSIRIDDPVKRFKEAFSSSKFSPKKSMAKFYGPLFDKLNLSEDEQQEFLDLMLSQNGASSRFIMVNGVPFSGNNNEVSDELKNFLGDDLATYEKYKKTAMERSQVNTMNKNLGEDDQLTSNQQELLVDLLHERKLASSNGNQVSDEEFMENTAGFLNDKQKAAFKQQLKSPISRIKTSFSIR